MGRHSQGRETRGCPVAFRHNHTWSVECRDRDGNRADVSVSTAFDRLTLTTGAETRSLSPVQAGRLRAALRDALLAMYPPVQLKSPTPARTRSHVIDPQMHHIQGGSAK